MKLLRFGPKGNEKPGLLDANGVIRDLSGVLPDLTSAQLPPARSPAWPTSTRAACRPSPNPCATHRSWPTSAS